MRLDGLSIGLAVIHTACFAWLFIWFHCSLAGAYRLGRYVHAYIHTYVAEKTWTSSPDKCEILYRSG